MVWLTSWLPAAWQSCSSRSSAAHTASAWDQQPQHMIECCLHKLGCCVCGQVHKGHNCNHLPTDMRVVQQLAAQLGSLSAEASLISSCKAIALVMCSKARISPEHRGVWR